MRVMVTLCATLVGLFATTPAHAGTYEVLACHADGRSDAWQPSANSGATAVYKDCPGNVLANGRVSDGMIVRNSGDANAPATYLNAGFMNFDAPPGARIVRVRGQAQMLANGAWQVGIHDQTNQRWLWCGPSCTSTFGSYVPFDVGGISASRVAGLVICGGMSCSRDGFQAYIRLINVVVTVQDDTPPSVSIADTGLAAEGWHRGDQTVVAQVGDNTGVRRVEAYLSGQMVFGDVFGTCNPWTPAPCQNGTAPMLARTSSVEDGSHTLSVRAIDSAGNVNEVARRVQIDNHAPPPPEDFELLGGEDWRSAEQFSMQWTNPAVDGTAPIAGVAYSICPSMHRATNTKDCVDGTRDGAESRLTLKAPGPGEWDARIWLRDAAGNADPSTARTVPLRFDPGAPNVAFEEVSPDDPTRIHVLATDPTSPLARGSIELRRGEEPTWRALPTEHDAHGFAAVLPDEDLPDGTYELRALVADSAGNERSTDRNTSGAPARIELPLRIKTRLAVGKAVRVRTKRGKRRRRLVGSPRVTYGRALRLSGRLTTPGSNPLAQRTIEVSQQTALPGAGWEPVGRVTSSKTGRFAFRVPSGPSRLLRFRYAGTPTIRGRTTDVRLRVRAVTSLRPNRRSVVNGEDVVFRGRLKGRPLSPTSKLVQLQAYTRGRWATFANPRANPVTGLWSFRYRFSATRGRVVYRIRAVIPRESSYPFETGRTRAVRVRVRGL